MSYNKVFRIIENEDKTKSIGPEVKLVAYGIDASEEDLLKQWVQQNFLALTGGELIGALVIKNLNADTSLEGERVDSKIISFVDKNYVQFGFLAAGQRTDGNRFSSLNVHFPNKNWGELAVNSDADGHIWGSCNTPPENAPSTAIQNKESVTRDFLSKAGGEISGDVYIKSDNLALDDLPSDIVNGHRLGFTDANGVQTAALYTRQHEDANKLLLISYGHHPSGAIHTNSLNVCYDKVNGVPYAETSPPRGLYVNDVATAKWVMDYAPQKLASNINIYINPTTGSDTADLHNGRGLTQDKPFKSFEAAKAWIETNIVSGSCTVFLTIMEDTAIGQVHLSLANIKQLYLSASNPSVNLSIAEGLVVDFGELRIFNITLTPNSATAWAAIQAVSRGIITIDDNVTINGGTKVDGVNPYANVRAVDGGLVRITQTATISGSATGQRYACINGGMIISNGKGVNAIPGTIAGTADANSKYI